MVDEKKKRNKKKKCGGSKKKIITEQTEAFKSVTDWVFVGSSSPLSSSSSLDDFAVTIDTGSLRCREKLVFELHSHSNRSDGFLSPSKLVEMAHNNGNSKELLGVSAMPMLLVASLFTYLLVTVTSFTVDSEYRRPIADVCAVSAGMVVLYVILYFTASIIVTSIVVLVSTLVMALAAKKIFPRGRRNSTDLVMEDIEDEERAGA